MERSLIRSAINYTERSLAEEKSEGSQKCSVEWCLGEAAGAHWCREEEIELKRGTFQVLSFEVRAFGIGYGESRTVSGGTNAGSKI